MIAVPTIDPASVPLEIAADAVPEFDAALPAFVGAVDVAVNITVGLVVLEVGLSGLADSMLLFTVVDALICSRVLDAADGLEVVTLSFPRSSCVRDSLF